MTIPTAAAGKAHEVRTYRLDVRLPRELSKKLITLQKNALDTAGKRVSKSELVVKILEQFFNKSPS